MKKLLKHIATSFAAVSLLILGGATLVPATVSAAPSQSVIEVCKGVRLTGGDCVEEKPGEGVNGIIRTVINLLSLAVGVISVIMVIIGGLKYVLSSGDSGNTDGTKILFSTPSLVW